MKNVVLFITVFVLSLSACAQKSAETSKAENMPAKLDTPVPWLQAKIWEYQSRQVSNPPR